MKDESSTRRPETDFDAIVVGSGFAGAVTACRLAEAGFAVCILERGRRFEPDDLPVYPPPSARDQAEDRGRDRIQPDFTRMFWAAGRGVWDFRDLGDVVSGQAAGYGGGSLIYANVHLRPPISVFRDWPAEYRGRALDPYFDLAAYMLGVDVAPDDRRLRKAEQLEAAGESLGLRTFKPPLTVNFGREAGAVGATKAHHAGRAACDLRGDCCLGCPTRSKNTLDLNYLALAEERGAEVRTLAEVVSLARSGEETWSVEYRDHLARGRLDLDGPPAGPQPPRAGELSRRLDDRRHQRTRITARNVFLCAGAVNTTELLLRNVGNLDGCRRDALGRSYFTNADTLAMTYDSDSPHEPDRGPTITTSMVYENGDDLILVQDGGMPTAMEPILGAFRSPLWLARNRFRDKPMTPGGSGVPQTGYAPLPFDSLADLLSGMPRAASVDVSALSHAVSEALRTQSRGTGWFTDQREGIREWALLPAQVREQLDVLGWDLLHDLTEGAGQMIGDALDEAAGQAEARFSTDEILGSALTGSLDVRGLEDQQLARRMMRLGMQLVWGSEGDMVRDVVLGALETIFPEPALFAERAAGLLQWALDHRFGSPHTGMLLAMGRDSKPGRLELAVPWKAGQTFEARDAEGTPLASGLVFRANLQRVVVSSTEPIDLDWTTAVLTIDGASTGPIVDAAPLTREASSDLVGHLFELTLRGPAPATGGPSPTDTAALRASLPPAGETPERALQETLLRGIAGTWNAELRTNPLWTFLGRRLTVHSMGGCSMDTDTAPGFTRPSGEVHGCDGLFVMDAAGFPSSVGANPSATIAAVAEYKVARFIESTGRTQTFAAAELDRAVEWAAENRTILEPLRVDTGAPSTLPAGITPIGIRFSETMQGFFRAPGTLADTEIDLDLNASISDLTRFLDDHRAAKNPTVAISGRATLHAAGAPTSTAASFPLGPSSLTLFSGSPRDRRLEYDLLFGPYRLQGQKEVRNDERFDVWEDTTTLKFQIEDQRLAPPVPGTNASGVVRLSASSFFGGQIPSFEVSGTSDPARILWAQLAFASFFFGNLVDVYLPLGGRLGDLVRQIGAQTHA